MWNGKDREYSGMFTLRVKRIGKIFWTSGNGKRATSKCVFPRPSVRGKIRGEVCMSYRKSWHMEEGCTRENKLSRMVYWKACSRDWKAPRDTQPLYELPTELCDHASALLLLPFSFSFSSSSLFAVNANSLPLLSQESRILCRIACQYHSGPWILEREWKFPSLFSFPRFSSRSTVFTPKIVCIPS